jgi:phage terminase large subunit-like protein
VVRTSAGATLECMSADAPSLYGLRPSLIIVDELAQWPSGAQAVWVAALSGMAKVPGARLVCLTSAGDPSHFSYRVRERAAVSPAWRLHEVAGPTPWARPEDLAEQKALLTDSQYQRLHLNVWVAPEDRLTTVENVRACVGHSGPILPVAGRTYRMGLDIGLVNDRTVLTVAHLERRAAGPTVVVDRQFTWQGTRANPVNLS